MGDFVFRTRRRNISSKTTPTVNMKWIISLISIAVCLFALTQGFALKDQRRASIKGSVGQDECLLCVDDIMEAIEHCNENGTATIECIEWALGAASDCIRCVCDIIDVIDGGDGT